MNIIGLEELHFGIDDVAAGEQFLTDYGLIPRGGGRFDALDGTAVVVKHTKDATLPTKTIDTANMLRKTVYGVANTQTLEAIAVELATDREVKRLADGSIESVDDMGFALGFMVTQRRPVGLPAERANAPGDHNRAANVTVSASSGPSPQPTPRTLSHVVYFVPDSARAEAFYIKRLGFRVVDRFIGMGPFLRPAGTIDHHTMFMIETPPQMKGCEHFTFHMGGPGEVFTAGWNMANKGYQSYWGPGRHRFGSNWFWYFNTPFGCHIEYDADMDLHDDRWEPRVVQAETDMSQIFLFDWREKWAPGGPPSKAQ